LKAVYYFRSLLAVDRHHQSLPCLSAGESLQQAIEKAKKIHRHRNTFTETFWARLFLPKRVGLVDRYGVCCGQQERKTVFGQKSHKFVQSKKERQKRKKIIQFKPEESRQKRMANVNKRAVDGLQSLTNETIFTKYRRNRAKWSKFWEPCVVVKPTVRLSWSSVYQGKHRECCFGCVWQKW
jgi:hypothetical protein